MLCGTRVSWLRAWGIETEMDWQEDWGPEFGGENPEHLEKLDAKYLSLIHI